jgi:hypothetical protein
MVAARERTPQESTKDLASLYSVDGVYSLFSAPVVLLASTVHLPCFANGRQISEWLNTLELPDPEGQEILLSCV